MFYVLLTVLANALLFVVFKLFDRYRIDTFQAITLNYIVAFSMGITASDIPVTAYTIWHAPWLPGAMILGIMFVVGFYLVGLTAQRLGLSVVAVSSKMSVAIPVVFGILAYHESTSIIKLTGVVLALLSVYLVSYNKTKLSHKTDMLLPLVLFLSSGAIDTALKYMQTNYVPNTQTSLFLSIIFLVAGTAGLVSLLLDKKGSWKLKNLYAGLLLGFINYFSMYFLLKALQSPGLESGTIFTINNVSIVMLSALIGVWAFREKLSPVKLAGLGLAVISIVIISVAD
jgi:drug/metabolite transporter (DMT)-like permease